LTRIESKAFSFSSLESVDTPRAVQFVNASAFIGSELCPISIEPGHVPLTGYPPGL
jgi:hypothetical protein